MKRPKKMSKPSPATPQQIILYGNVAATLREYIKANSLTPMKFNELVGMKPANPGIYNYLNSKAAPGVVMRARITKATGIPESALLPRGMAPSVTVATVKPVAMPKPKPKDVLSFNVENNGMATLTLNAYLPVTEAMPLLRMLLDAGLVFTKPE